MPTPSPPAPPLTPETQPYIPTLHNLSHAQSHRVIWFLEELHLTRNLTYNLKNYHRSTKRINTDIKKAGPLGKAPILTLDPTPAAPPGGLPKLQPPCPPGTMIESRLILNWLSETYGAGLYVPDTPEERSADAFWTEFAGATLTIKTALALTFDIIKVVLPWPFNKGLGVLTGFMVKHFVGDLDDVFLLMERELEGRTVYEEGERWFGGRKLGLSDVNLSWGMVSVGCCLG
ncbi:hypothetical protein HDV00_009723 [Rhizophlyctis rosea]|nr:hypothetical protein HDV00_009723 [Rhizophlyctis rosea]